MPKARARVTLADDKEIVLDPIETLAVVLSLAAVWWTSTRNPICWPVGLVSVLLYGWIFFGARLYSDALLQLVYAALQCYGWWHWRRVARAARSPDASASACGAQEGAPRRRPPVVRPQARQLAATLGAGGVGALALGAVMGHYTDAALPWLDATLAALSLVAQYWMARLYRLNWLLWIGVDLVYVLLYLNRALPLTAALYVGFVVLAGVGWWKWQSPPAQH
jgi:nicotinamide mononucleotide transporter